MHGARASFCYGKQREIQSWQDSQSLGAIANHSAGLGYLARSGELAI